MITIRSWQGLAAVLLIAVVATAEESANNMSTGRPNTNGTNEVSTSFMLQAASQAAASNKQKSDSTEMFSLESAPRSSTSCCDGISTGCPLPGNSCPGMGGGCGPKWFPIGRITLCSPPHKFWYGEVTAVGLLRDAEPSGRPIATLDTTTNVVLDSEQAWPDFRPGGIVRIGKMCTPRWGIEYGYLGVDNWRGDAAVRDLTPNTPGGLGNLFSPFGDFGATPVDDFDYNNLVSIRGSTHLESFELSLRQRLCMPAEPLQVSVFYGIRYIDLNERFAYYSQTQVPLATGATQSIDVRTKNDLFGAQLGTLFEWHIEPRWWFDARLSAGLYNNRAGQTTHHIETGDNPGENFLSATNNRGTVGAEVSLGLAYYFSQRLSVRFGYHFLWLDRVALGSENFETNPTLLRQGPGQLDNDGTIMFHGPFLGAGVSW